MNKELFHYLNNSNIACVKKGTTHTDYIKITERHKKWVNIEFSGKTILSQLPLKEPVYRPSVAAIRLFTESDRKLIRNLSITKFDKSQMIVSDSRIISERSMNMLLLANNKLHKKMFIRLI